MQVRFTKIKMSNSDDDISYSAGSFGDDNDEALAVQSPFSTSRVLAELTTGQATAVAHIVQRAIE
jgi:hypothetical protein